MGQRDATLEELLRDPLVRLVMASDGYDADDVRLLVRQAHARMRQARRKTFLRQTSRVAVSGRIPEDRLQTM